MHFIIFAFQGVNLRIKVWDKDDQNIVGNQQINYDEVDEFSYDLTDIQGSNPRLIPIDGLRKMPSKTR